MYPRLLSLLLLDPANVFVSLGIYILLLLRSRPTPYGLIIQIAATCRCSRTCDSLSRTWLRTRFRSILALRTYSYKRVDTHEYRACDERFFVVFRLCLLPIRCTARRCISRPSTRPCASRVLSFQSNFPPSPRTRLLLHFPRLSSSSSFRNSDSLRNHTDTLIKRSRKNCKFKTTSCHSARISSTIFRSIVSLGYFIFHEAGCA